VCANEKFFCVSDAQCGKELVVAQYAGHPKILPCDGIAANMQSTFLLTLKLLALAFKLDIFACLDLKLTPEVLYATKKKPTCLSKKNE
jgi:hypothetical protein